jgi:DNA-binding IclR family transcriptional regulator
MPDRPLRTAPSYAITSVDHALRIATMLQLEGGLTVSQVADRLGVARSTAHRLLAMLVYRDFAVQQEDRSYRAGPVLELAAHSQSQASRLRAASLPHLQRLVDVLDESANLIIRSGDTARFVASVECQQPLRVTSREGMVFPAHTVTGGLLTLAGLSRTEIETLYDEGRYADRPGQRPDLDRLRRELSGIRRNGFSVNEGRSERGVVAVGVPVHGPDGTVLAGLSVSMPQVRYDRHQLKSFVSTLALTARSIRDDL